MSAHFAELNALVNKGEGEPAAIDALLADLNALYVQVSAMSGASGDALLGEAKNQASAAATRVSLTPNASHRWSRGWSNRWSARLPIA
ncbi:hypothetical protein [Pseudomonas sp. FEN]|uniref:hypothetical protein n=1 Tax=Pseudomonas sp. FEN TaxID=2767468 RepID=UPI00398FB4A8